MRVFVTGASGFVGGAAARHLAETGHAVTAMSRTPGSDAAIAALGARPVRAALNRIPPGTLDGTEALVHCAAHVEQSGPWEPFQRITVDGTADLIARARAAGVRRFVHIGSEAALFHGQPMQGIDETYPLALTSPFPYPRSKALSEHLVRKAEGIETIVLRPRMIWGPGDATLLPVAARMQAQGKWSWIDGGRMLTSTTHIANLCHGIGLALDRGHPGRAYFLTDGPPQSFRAFFQAYAAAAGIALADRSIPGWAARGIAALTEPLARLAGREPPLTRYAAALMSRDCTLDDSAARADLGYAPVLTVAAGLAALAAEGPR